MPKSLLNHLGGARRLLEERDNALGNGLLLRKFLGEHSLGLLLQILDVHGSTVFEEQADHGLVSRLDGDVNWVGVQLLTASLEALHVDAGEIMLAEEFTNQRKVLFLLGRSSAGGGLFLLEALICFFLLLAKKGKALAVRLGFELCSVLTALLFFQNSNKNLMKHGRF